MTTPSIQEPGNQGFSAPQADGLSPTVEPVPVSPIRASIPSAFTHDWRGEVSVAATEHSVSRDALNAAIFAWVMKMTRWEAVDTDEVLKGFAREQQARMGMAMAMGAALAAAQGSAA